jgi:hypothetical protein
MHETIAAFVGWMGSRVHSERQYRSSDDDPSRAPELGRSRRSPAPGSPRALEDGKSA